MNKKQIMPRPRQTENYAEIYITAGQTAQNILEFAGDYTLVTNWSANGSSKRCVAGYANNKITIYKPGFYFVSGSFSFFSTTDSVVFWGAPFLNAVLQSHIHWKKTLGTKTNVINVGFVGIIVVSTVPVDLDFRVRHATAATVSITIEYGNFNCFYIGGNE